MNFAIKMPAGSDDGAGKLMGAAGAVLILFLLLAAFFCDKKAVSS